ncbi:hypothetical protein ISS07_04750 [Candidatus Woesearchaeota archaeon]|nr:hypothetical protein [Candidatus Woesearchaeota archaeon]
MKDISLQYRISEAHFSDIGADLPTHNANDVWSYARHLPADWDTSKVQKRALVPERLLDNLRATPSDGEVDLTPLKDDQRAAGHIFGDNPLRNMYEILTEYANSSPKSEWFAKWGGGKVWMKGEGFAIYLENGQEATKTIEDISSIADSRGVSIKINHRFGITRYRDYVEVDESFRSAIKDRMVFRGLLEGMIGYEHFSYKLFESHP